MFSKWGKGEPNDQYNEDCIHGNYFQNEFWNDMPCDYKASVICYKKKPGNKYNYYIPLNLTENKILLI